jgi:two-component system chemotaxis response regulator CheY
MAQTILVVDDSASIRQLLSYVLGGAGYQVIEAVDGEDALGKLQGRQVHLIISDVNMPKLDGISFVKQVKQQPAYQQTPVIMLTTESKEAKKHEGRDAGAKAWVVKPFQPPQLLNVVQRLVLP